MALHSCFQPASPSTPHTTPLHMYHVSAQDIDERIINVHSSSYYYYNAKVPARTPNHKKFVCVCKAISGNCRCHNNDPHDNIHVMPLFMNDCGSPVPKTSAGNTKLAGSIKVEWKTAQSCVCRGGGGAGSVYFLLLLGVEGGGEAGTKNTKIKDCCALARPHLEYWFVVWDYKIDSRLLLY